MGRRPCQDSQSHPETSHQKLSIHFRGPVTGPTPTPSLTPSTPRQSPSPVSHRIPLRNTPSTTPKSLLPQSPSFTAITWQTPSGTQSSSALLTNPPVRGQEEVRQPYLRLPTPLAPLAAVVPNHRIRLFTLQTLWKSPDPSLMAKKVRCTRMS